MTSSRFYRRYSRLDPETRAHLDLRYEEMRIEQDERKNAELEARYGVTAVTPKERAALAQRACRDLVEQIKQENAEKARGARRDR